MHAMTVPAPLGSSRQLCLYVLGNCLVDEKSLSGNLVWFSHYGLGVLKAISDTHTHPPLLFPGIDWTGFLGMQGPQGPRLRVPCRAKVISVVCVSEIRQGWEKGG